MVGGGTVAGFAVGGADAVSVLRDFEGGPVEAGQGGDQTGDYAGLADAAGVSANDEDGHVRLLFAFRSWLFALALAEKRLAASLRKHSNSDAQRSFLADLERNASSLRY